MYKYLKKIIHNLWHNCLLNLVLSKNLSSHSMGINAALTKNWLGLCLVCLSSFVSLGMSLVCTVHFRDISLGA